MWLDSDIIQINQSHSRRSEIASYWNSLAYKMILSISSFNLYYQAVHNFNSTCSTSTPNWICTYDTCALSIEKPRKLWRHQSNPELSLCITHLGRTKKSACMWKVNNNGQVGEGDSSVYIISRWAMIYRVYRMIRFCSRSTLALCIYVIGMKNTSCQQRRRLGLQQRGPARRLTLF